VKIALFVHCFFPTHFYGTETYTLELANNLKKLGHEPVVVSAIFPGEPKTEKVITYYTYNEIPVYCIDKNCIPDTRVKDTYYQPLMHEVIKEVLLDIKPDLVHVTHLINHTAVLIEAAKDLGIPIVATFTDFFGFCFNNKLQSADGTLCLGPNAKRTNCLACLLTAQSQNNAATPIQNLLGRHPLSSLAANVLNLLSRVPGLDEGKIAGFVFDITKRPDILASCYSHYAAVIAPTKFLRDAYVANGLSVPINLIRFGIDLPRLPKPERSPGAPIKFGFIGQIAAHKGTDILINAFCQLRKESAELHIFGPEDQDPEYMLELKRKAVGFAVFFNGTFPKEKMADIFSELDFLIIPSTWYENSPLVLLNSLASHTPVVVSNVEGMTEFVEEGKNGYIFSRGSVSDLFRVLKKIIDAPEKAREMSHTTEYTRTSKMMAEDVMAVYNRAKKTKLKNPNRHYQSDMKDSFKR
jgi:glycosyltransferase involved in cell wall biosynthesis